jgi:hypothetical protein
VTDIQPGPLYRTGPLTWADYDEVINDLCHARDALTDGIGDSHGCVVCGDSGCASNICHHNALVMAREYAQAKTMSVCSHCGYVARTQEEAEEHFGTRETETALCIRNSLPEEPLARAYEDCARIADAFATGQIKVAEEEGSDPGLVAGRETAEFIAKAIRRRIQHVLNSR